MSNVVVISGHPDLTQSHTNSVILNELSDQLKNIDIRKLDALYPDYKIDIEAEQKALMQADVIVMQFPYYWYSVPALLKKWIDDVFAFNFAFGPEGDKLKDKHFILSFTVGGAEESYHPQGFNHFRIEQTLHPLEQLAYLSGMNYQKPIYTYGMVYIPGVYNKLEDVQEKARLHAKRLSNSINSALNSVESRVNQFVKKWFSQFDLLPEDDSYFIKQLSENVELEVPEGSFKGHAGFRDCYSNIRKTIKPGCRHEVQQVQVNDKGNGQYNVDLRVKFAAETYTGEKIEMLINEQWLVTLSSNGQVSIHQYLANVVGQ
ncbi:NAD(P)H-dependent oxidoreductase [Vibrio sp. JC009]|uniref:NAD(P)H-dependent oxidoreductase n=1 Tax=Vibrio sp. JC009 TaxID=2912314 RepID=UPI0023B0F97C|nr:NAD(P)H-dependent oxidoreductase [Vibrio sp. JC009]WED23806.1 NAD(P)H-dependent oxidoreductase [Vibrio sp. JC009]